MCGSIEAFRKRQASLNAIDHPKTESFINIYSPSCYYKTALFAWLSSVEHILRNTDLQ